MNVLLVDTSSWITFLRGSPHAELEVALKEGRVYLSPVVVAEILSSFRPESKRKNFIQFLKELPLCETGFDHWVRVGSLRTALASRGLVVSTPDAHIAQCALDLDGYLMSEDAIFARIAEVTALRLIKGAS